MNPQFERLTNSLTQIFKREPIPKPAISIGFSLPNMQALLSIDNHTMSVNLVETNLSSSPFDTIYRDRDMTITTGVDAAFTTIPPIKSLTYDLRDWTFEALLEDLNMRAGFTALSVDERTIEMVAASLMDGIADADL